eukprot:scaffold17118_cov40-Prasinocladus_malaysianus.AAC.2
MKESKPQTCYRRGQAGRTPSACEALGAHPHASSAARQDLAAALAEVSVVRGRPHGLADRAAHVPPLQHLDHR